MVVLIEIERKRKDKKYILAVKTEGTFWIQRQEDVEKGRINNYSLTSGLHKCLDDGAYGRCGETERRWIIERWDGWGNVCLYIY